MKLLRSRAFRRRASAGRAAPPPEPPSGGSESVAEDDVAACLRSLALREGDAMARLLATPFFHRVRRVLQALVGGDEVLADDALQEGCLKLWRTAPNREPRSPREAEAWVLRVFANAARDLLRHDLRTAQAERAAVAWTGRAEPEYDTGAAAFDAEDAAQRLRALLARRLSEREQRVLLADLELDRDDGDTVLARRLDTTKQNLRTIRCRARKKLGDDRDVGSVCGKLLGADPPAAGGPTVLS